MSDYMEKGETMADKQTDQDKKDATSNTTKVKRDEKGRIVVAENVQIIFNATICEKNE